MPLSDPEVREARGAPAVGGAMGYRVRAFDGSTTSLGPIETRSERLKALVELVLTSRQAMYLAAGDDLVLIGNDAYEALLQGNRRETLGVPFRVAFAHISAEMEPLLASVLEGRPHVVVAQRFPVPWRSDRPEAGFTFSLSPVLDRDGSVFGFLASVMETTDKLLNELAIRESEERQAFLLRLSDALRPIADPFQVKEIAARLLGEHLGVDHAAYGEFLPDGEHLMTEGGWTREGASLVTGYRRVVDFEAFFRNIERGEVAILEDTQVDYGVTPALHEATWEFVGVRAAIAYPFVKHGKVVAIFYLHSLTPRRWSSGEVSLVAEVGERTWDAAERARAEA
ncbi:GAF domain-containing protein, partial [Singulisphaera rosea]